MKERPPGHDRVVAKEHCPKCGSKDNLVRYADGHAHCFTPGCGHWERAEGEEGRIPDQPAQLYRGPMIPKTEAIAPTKPKFRGIKKETRARYGVFAAMFGSRERELVQVYPEYKDGRLVAQKLRTKAKDFPILKADPEFSLAKADLWGRHVYGDRYDRRLIITEGEEDAMAVAEVLDFKSAVVSLTGGADSAKACLQANYHWVDRFSDIILWFDDDEHGQRAIKECAGLFANGKMRTARVDGFKDANEVLEAGKPGDIEAAVYMATALRKPGIVNAADCRLDLKDGASKQGWEYPWPTLNKKTFGIRPGEVVLHVSGTGMGKTTGLYEVAYKLLQQEVKVGLMHFEDTRADVQIGLMSLAANQRLAINPVDPAEMDRLHAEVFGSKRVELFDPDTAEWSIEAIFGYLRYMAKALECEALFFDPLSFVVAGSDISDNQVQLLDKASRDLATLTKELGVALHVSHHLSRPKMGPAHEEGAAISLNQVRGSSGLANFAAIVLAWEGDLQGDAPNLRRLRILKNRPIGASHAGLAGVLSFDDTTGRYTEFFGEYPDRWADEGGGKRGGGKKGGFGSAADF